VSTGAQGRAEEGQWHEGAEAAQAREAEGAARQGTAASQAQGIHEASQAQGIHEASQALQEAEPGGAQEEDRIHRDSEPGKKQIPNLCRRLIYFIFFFGKKKQKTQLHYGF
jgi:hypothetical protein